MSRQEMERSLERLLQKCRELENKINESSAVISSLRAENESLRKLLAEQNSPVSNDSGDDTDISFAQDNADSGESNSPEIRLDPKLDLAAEYIGRAVRIAAEFCGNADKFEEGNRRDLINLALGRTEVFKSDVVSVMSSDLPYESKRIKLASEYDEFAAYIEDLKLQK